MRRTDLLDTSPESHRVLVQLLREKGPEWRIRRTFELSAELAQLRKATEHLRPKRPYLQQSVSDVVASW